MHVYIYTVYTYEFEYINQTDSWAWQLLLALYLLFCVNSELQSRTYCETVLKNVPHAFDGNWQPSWFCLTFSTPKPVESNIPINSSDFPEPNQLISPNSPVESTKIPCWCALGRPLSMWIGKMLMCLGVFGQKNYAGKTFLKVWKAKSGVKPPPERGGETPSLGINKKNHYGFWVSIFFNLFFCQYLQRHPWWVALGFHTTSWSQPLVSLHRFEARKAWHEKWSFSMESPMVFGK